MALTVYEIAHWPATPKMKSMRPAIAERLHNPGLYCVVQNAYGVRSSAPITDMKFDPRKP